MGIKDILGKALSIGQEAKFLVRIYEDPVLFIESEMTYIQLGMYLVANPTAIDRVDIHLI